MKTRAAVVWEAGARWEIEEIELDEPRAGEVLVRYVASGLCHSDEHLRDGTLVHRLPMVGGHEGAGVVETVGPGVTTLAPGDHIVTSWMPHCGVCRFCIAGRSNLCDRGASLMDGHLLDGTFRMHVRGHDLGAMGFVGTFSERCVIPEGSAVKVDADLPLDVLALTACGVPTGWGSAVYAAGVTAGEVVVVFGVGGVGMNAVQGASHAGASVVVAVDPVEHKRELALTLGATHTFATAAAAKDFLWEHTWGVGADKGIVTAGVVESDLVLTAFETIRKGGTLVLTGVGNDSKGPVVQLPIDPLIFLEKVVRGSLFGSGNPRHDIPKMAGLYRSGQLKLDELITRRYKLEDINQGYEDMLTGRNVRGLIIHEH